MSALDVLASLVLEDGRRWGEAATGWQWDDARAILDPADTEPRLHYLTRPRGASKTADLAGVAVAAMLEQLPPGAQCYGFAADADQAGLLLDSIDGYARRDARLASLVTVRGRWVATVGGATLHVMPADAAGSYGLRPHLIIVDEIAQWTATPTSRKLWEAIVSSVQKVPGCRLVLLTSAGDPVHWAHKVLEIAKRRPAWRVHEVAGPVPWIGEGALAEQRALLTESQYARLHLNRWTAAEDRLVSAEDLDAALCLTGAQPPQRGYTYVMGLDVGVTHDRTAVALGHVEPVHGEPGRPTLAGTPLGPLVGARVVVDALKVWRGSAADPVQLAEVEAWIARAAADYRAVELVFDPYQAVDMGQRLARRGLAVTPFTFSSSSVGRLALSLHTLLRSRSLVLPDVAALRDELEHVRLRETSPGVYRIDHDPDRHDDMAIAVALAAQRLVEVYQRGARPLRLDDRVGTDAQSLANARQERARRHARRRSDPGLAGGVLGRVS